jgi:hypothetical protein
MIPVVQQIFENTMAQFSHRLTTFLPSLIVAATILLGAYVAARLARWIILRAVKAITLDRFLRDSGIKFMFDRSSRIRGADLLAGTVFWTILGIGLLTAVDAFDSRLTSRMIEATVFAIPKLLIAGLILLAGFWLAQYLGRGALVWAVNDGIPFGRRIAMGVRIVIVFIAVVVAADTLDFARNVFFAAFVILVGAAAFGASLALGLGLRPSIERRVHRREDGEVAEHERSLWSHL